MPRGGRRSGAPGKTYANRTDMAQAPRAVPGQTYGKAKEQMDAQRAVPVAAPSLPSAPAAAPRQGVAATGPLPGTLGFAEPTARPGEPVTAGMAMGPGPGPEVLGDALTGPDVGMQLRAIYSRFPTEELRALIEELDDLDG